MADTTFIDRQTPIVANWLNDVNTRVYKTILDITSDPYNGDNTGIVDATTSITNALAEVTNIQFGPGSWTVSSTPTFSGAKVLHATPGAVMAGTGAGALGFYTGKESIDQTIYWNSIADSGPNHYIRRFANHTGGTTGFVNNAFSVRTDVTNEDNTNFEWAGLFVLDNYANAASLSQNAALYVQATRNNGGITFGFLSEVLDPTGVANPSTGLVATEIDIRANGTDSLYNRVGIDMVVTRNVVGGVYSGAAMEAGYGFRVGHGGDPLASVVHAFSCLGNHTVGFDTANATISSAAVRLATNQAIVFDGAGDSKLTYDTLGLSVQGAGGSLLFRVNDTGVCQFGINSTVAGTPASFVANRTIRIQQNDGTVLYVPVMLSTW